MTEIRRVGVSKLALWSEAERFQTYPRGLTRLAAGRTYTRQQIGSELFGLSFKPDGAASRDGMLTGLFGLLQIADDKLLLRGINLFQRVTPHGAQMVAGIKKWELASDVWSPSPSAFVLGERYRSDPAGTAWQVLLAEQLARYEVRVRTFLHLLSNGHALRFEKGDYFSGNTQQAELVGRRNLLPFAHDGAAVHTLLAEFAEVAVGPWWRAEFEEAGFDLARAFAIEGAVNATPSTQYVNSAMKTALYVFRALGILVCTDNLWHVDPVMFGRLLSPDLTRELIGEAYSTPALADDWQRLAYTLTNLADDQGFVIAAEAVQRWGELADVPSAQREQGFDTLVRRGIFEGRITLLDHHLGQPRMGRGLFGDDNMRMVRLQVQTS